MLHRKPRKLSLITALVTLLTVLVIPTGGALAVDISLDCSTGDLQATINAASPNDTIIIDDATTCQGNFVVNKALTIRAATAAGATLDGDAVDGAPVVNIATAGSVTLQDLTITGGLNTAPGTGGGILSNSATLTLTDVTVSGNDADLGAGMYIGGGTVTMSGGSIIDNSASSTGGGVWNNGTATFSGVTIGSGASPNTAADGGGLYNSGTLTINAATTVDSNTSANATGGGGGVWNDGILNVTNATVEDNTAVNGGGGIHNVSGGDVTITNSTISGNSAEHAGGILNNGAGDTVDSSVTLIDSVVSGNSATGSNGEPAGGGGIFNFSFPTDTLKAQLTLTDSDVLTNTSAEGGAGIRNADSDATITGGEIDGNIATGNGGGIRTSGTMTITDGTISDNNATVSGGGISLDGDGSTLALITTDIDSNTAGANGGGVDIAPNTAASLTRSSATGNAASVGGGISNAGVNSVANSTLSGNTASTQGGGIHTSGNLTVNHATIHNNDATSEGGGIRVIGVPTVTVTGTILWGNTGGSGEDCSGPLASGGYNLVGLTAAPCAYAGDPSDLAPGSDPMLGPLTSGSPQYHPLLTGSDAIDAAAPNCGLSVDQNGDPRPDGPACDVGAIEGATDAVADDVLLVEPNGRWHIRRPGQADYTFFYGDPGDVPIFGDWNGDGLDTPGAYRVGPGGGFAYLTNTLPSNGGVGFADFNFYFGDPSLGDEVLVGDWDGDGIDTLGVNRNGRIFLTDTNASGGAPAPTDYDFFFGVAGDRAFGGDPNGDGRDGLFLYRGSGPGAGFVYYRNALTTGVADDNFFFGIESDLFVAGDWDIDGVDTAGIFRGSNTTVFLTNTNASGGAPAPTDESYVWGTAGWTPVAGVHGVS